MILNELFYSLQGEGQLAGVPSVFVRLAGCPLHCRWCDTKYAWDASAGTETSPEQIIDRVGEFPTRYVVLTGGEPIIHKDLTKLACLLHRDGYHVTIETAGLKCPEDLVCDLMSISPKLANSLADPITAEKTDWARLNLDCLQRLIESYSYQLKFVVDQPQDLDEVAECLQQLNNVDPYKVYLMPQATSLDEYLEKSRWLAEYCLQSGFSLSPRLQVVLWENRRGK